MNAKPIGIFDSGLGGLTVLKNLKKILPNEDYIYLGDTARVPYGTRSDKIITKFALQDTQFLVEKGVKCIVIACNTASSVASDRIRSIYKVPIFDVVSSTVEYFGKIRYVNRKIFVIGTSATILSGKYQKMIGKIFGNNKSVIGKPCPLLVPLVEEGELNTKITEYVLNKYLGKINWSYYDYLILGCTHYSLLMKPITKIIGKKIRLINPSELVANDVKEYLKANRLTKEDTKKSLTKYYITDIINKFADKASMFLGEKIHNHTYQIDIE